MFYTGYRRTTGGFDSKNYCDNRTYMYICPTYAFAAMETVCKVEMHVFYLKFLCTFKVQKNHEVIFVCW